MSSERLFGVLDQGNDRGVYYIPGNICLPGGHSITIAALLCFFIVLQSVLAMMKKKKVQKK